MFRFCSLFSGSSGNCFFVQSDTTKILVDCGESAKKISNALSSMDINIENIDGILITHEHVDHVKSLSTLSKKYNLPIYINKKTYEALDGQKEKLNLNNISFFDFKNDFNVGDLKIHPFSTPHDAANPCGFNIFYKKKKISIATDLGHVTPEILSSLEKSKFVFLESNYDENTLKCSSYPYILKERISGPYGHLSNEMAGKTISHLMKFGLKSAMLGHLSKENNFPELAYKTVMDEIIFDKNSESNINLSVATRYTPTQFIDI